MSAPATAQPRRRRWAIVAAAAPALIISVWAVYLVPSHADAPRPLLKPCQARSLVPCYGQDPLHRLYGMGSLYLSSLVLHLLPDPAHALRHWLRLLVPGGTAGFSEAIKPNPRWSPVFAAADRGAGNGGGFRERIRRLAPPRRVRGLFSHCAHVQITTPAAVLPVRYGNAQQWCEAAWSEEPFAVRRTIPGAIVEIARREAFGVLDTIRETNGSLIRRVEMGFAIAHRPQPRSQEQEGNSPLAA